MLWRPSLRDIAPRGVIGKSFKVWWLFHHLRLFANRDYALFVIYHEGMLVHRSGVYPGYLRFPFMAPDDLQIGNTWTSPHERGRGLASAAIAEIIRLLARPGRNFWYLVESENVASIRVVERAGFRLAGVGERRPRLGLRFLGAFYLNNIAGSERRV